MLSCTGEPEPSRVDLPDAPERTNVPKRGIFGPFWVQILPACAYPEPAPLGAGAISFGNETVGANWCNRMGAVGLVQLSWAMMKAGRVAGPGRLMALPVLQLLSVVKLPGKI